MGAPQDLPAVLAVIEMRWAEEAAGSGVAPLETWIARFPGYEDVVRDEYERRTQDAAASSRPSAAAAVLEEDRRAGRAGSLLDYASRFPALALEIADRLAADDHAAALDEGGVDGGAMPEKIGPYTLLRELGRGAQGEVYLAEDPRLGRRVAIKLLRRVLGPAEALARFRREAAATSRLDHPGICTVHDVGEHDGRPWLVMRWIEGETLAVRLSRARSEAAARPSVQEVCALVEQVALALAAAHDAGIVHRDVKPGNLMVAGDGTPVVLDFGLARLTDSADRSLTAAGELVGTPAYMSPEQLRPGANVDHRTDVYSLGVVLYEGLTLERPFAAPTVQGTCRAILEAPLPDARRQNPAIGREVETVLRTALERDPDRRYESARTFAEDLRRVRVREPILARPPGPALRLRRWIQRNPVVAALTLLLFATLSVAVVAGTLQNRALRRALTDVRRLADRRLVDAWHDAVLHVPTARPEDAAAVRAWLQEAGALARRLPLHESRLAALQAAPERTDVEQWELESLRELVARLRAFTAAPHGMLAIMRGALEFLETVEQVSLVDAADPWRATVAAIADRARSPHYDGLQIAPQLGLVPIGKDPRSGLYEFSHLRTGTVARRDREGRIVPEPANGIVFVLIPGGTFRMGCLKPSAEHPLGAPLVDPHADGSNSPPVDVALAPFLISKYELTQAQYLRFRGDNPSLFPVGRTVGAVTTTELHPVENLSWTTCDEMVRAMGLVLPTEAQWEYAARAGTTTVWFTGDDRESLRGYANLADRSIVRAGVKWPPADDWPELDDGFPAHAPVGSFAANRFGLHDVAGNVAEWCRDVHVHALAGPRRGGDGLRADATGPNRVVRGGAFNTAARRLRSTWRGHDTPGTHANSLGLRPVRALDR